MSRFRRSILLPATALAPFAIATSAVAQTPPASGDESAVLSEVVVTGTRLTAEGFVQPTPTTMLNTEDLEKSAHPNIFNTIVELPSLQGSTGRGTFTFSTSSGLQGLSSFSMRGLGAIRTLTLLDGQRVVGANVTGVTDVSQFPQLLVKRVDVVTGGASASYGSDAIGGVVNFITDTEFEGFKTNVEYGQTTYEDDENLTVQAAWGHNFLGDRIHVQLSGEHGREDGIDSPGFGVDNGPNGRDWFRSAQLQSRPVSQTNDGRPQLFYIENAQQFQYSKYGLITNGPLQGWAFGDNGQPYRFEYGSNGVPTGTGAVTGCITPFCVGGELDGVVSNGTSLASKLERSVGYGRIGFDINDDHQIYATFNVARVVSSNTPNPGAAKNANLTIQCANPFVPAQIQQLCVDNGITSFQYGVTNAIFPRDISVHPTREQDRFVLGALGNFEIAGKEWTYDAYYEHGANETDLHVQDISLTSRYNAAIDATLDGSGNIVCRNVAARNAGCIPLNIIGNVTPSTGALAYVLPENGPHQFTKSTQEVVSVNISGEPFSSWAGEVAVAAGVEWREEWYRVTADPYGNGVYPDSPNTPDYPADPLMNTVSGNNWYAGNYHNGSGKYDVKEAYLEFNVPVLKSESLGDINFNLAARTTDYSTAGKVNTWKIGANWETGIEGLRFRAVTSRDVRAPNLSELFAAPTVTNNAVNNNGSTVTVLQQNIGNEDLRSEVARNNTFGIVLSQPSWAPGFQASIDYYDIKLDGGISTLNAQQMVDLCNAGNQELCDAMLLTSPIPNTNFIRVQAFNLASIENKGFDVELAYRREVGSSNLTARLLATHTISFLTDSGVLGTIPSEAAGVNSGFTPDWKYLAVQSWDTDKFNLTLTERWFSDGVYSNEYIECQTDCPVSTAVHPTIDDNQMKGAFYLDFGGSWSINDHSSAYFKVDNLLDEAPEPSPGTNTGQGVNPYLYDILGRMYRVGVRFSF
jgi:iron complex outermembrane recepter protein